mmetsp:Transcript_98575/g.256892  ORF Transcript_98575/g.256892 Transcript_98575/m.256892 type:complete len:151 (+) Transcript_98575:81-533(+)
MALATDGAAGARRRRSVGVLLALCTLLGWRCGDSAGATSRARGAAFFSFGPPGPSARASHILVKTESEARELLNQLGSAPSYREFGALASKHSTCPSGAKWGDLGSFEPGQMVPEFDAVCFDVGQPLAVPIGPVQTQFGYHIIWVEERSG